ncbi:MAG: murein biosynthesis integral membrane protein MurJ [Tissierellia bacterium]|nr:murein biosynthesis integral membrane protein MurJ [Tissierellia bacterium]
MSNTSVLLMIITVGTKVFGLAREKALAHFFGTQAMSAIFLVAFSFPMVLSNLFSGTIASGFIPMYTHLEEERGRGAADGFTLHLNLWVALFSILLSLLAIVFARELVGLLSPGFSGEVFETAVFMCRITAMSIISTAVGSIWKSYLQVRGAFIPSILHSVVMNTVLIVGMYLGRGGEPVILAASIVAAFFLQYLIFIPGIWKVGFAPGALKRPREELKSMGRLMLPILISTSVLELNFLVNKALASEISLSGISILNYATKIQGFITGIVVTSIITVLYPRMSREVEQGSLLKVSESFAESASLMLALVLPASVGVMIFSEEIVRLLFLGGAFTEADVAATGTVLLFYAAGLVATGLREIAIRIFYSMKELKVPVVNGVVMVSLNILLSFLLSRSLGMRGFGIATSLSLFVGALDLFRILRKRMPMEPVWGKLGNLLKILLASLIMALAARALYGYIQGIFSPALSLISAIGAAGGVYLLSALILKLDELAILRGIFGKIFKK